VDKSKVLLWQNFSPKPERNTHILLIMDEPTNHLDVEMVEWLENYLSKEKITLLLVTHDRYFLDSVCDIIWEMEDKNLYVHKEVMLLIWKTK
jgi:ATPase subunit of ABC transporter with duplicated ATPase domains